MYVSHTNILTFFPWAWYRAWIDLCLCSDAKLISFCYFTNSHYFFAPYRPKKFQRKMDYLKNKEKFQIRNRCCKNRSANLAYLVYGALQFTQMEGRYDLSRWNDIISLLLLLIYLLSDITEIGRITGVACWESENRIKTSASVNKAVRYFSLGRKDMNRRSRTFIIWQNYWYTDRLDNQTTHSLKIFNSNDRFNLHDV